MNGQLIYRQHGQEQDQGFWHLEEKDNDANIHDSLFSSCLLIGFRIFAFILILVRFFLNLVMKYHSLFFIFQFLTHIGFSSTLLYYALIHWDLILNEIFSFKLSPKLKNYIVVLYQIAFCLEVPITVLYWFIIYKGGSTTIQIILDAGNHGLPLLCLLFEMFFNVMPFYRKHLKYVMGVTFIYLFINMVYSLAVEPVYSIITWKSVASYVWVTVAIVAVLGMHLLGQFVWQRYKNPRYEQQLQRRRQLGDEKNVGWM